MAYRYLADVTHADVAFEAEGESLEELFRSAADATMAVMVEDLASIEERETRAVSLDSRSAAMPEAAEELLHGFLDQLIFLKDAEQLLLRAAVVTIRPDSGRFRLEAEFRGERLDPRRHELIVDVKAITMHRFKVERTSTNWRATVVLDV